MVEIIEYGDDDMMKALDTMRNFTFELILKEDTFSQITVDSEGNRTFQRITSGLIELHHQKALKISAFLFIM